MHDGRTRDVLDRSPWDRSVAYLPERGRATCAQRKVGGWNSTCGPSLHRIAGKGSRVCQSVTRTHVRMDVVAHQDGRGTPSSYARQPWVAGLLIPSRATARTRCVFVSRPQRRRGSTSAPLGAISGKCGASTRVSWGVANLDEGAPGAGRTHPERRAVAKGTSSAAYRQGYQSRAPGLRRRARRARCLAECLQRSNEEPAMGGRGLAYCTQCISGPGRATGTHWH